MLEKIEEEKKREADNKSLIKSRGELLMNIRAALQNMSSILVCVKASNKIKLKDGKKHSKEAEDIAEEEDAQKTEKDKKVCDDPIETEGTNFLSIVIC